MIQRTDVNEKAQFLSTEELSKIISSCENAIADGSAGIEDYEAFVVCQQELARRTWSQA